MNSSTEKWADYLITHIRRDRLHNNRISMLRIRADQGHSIGKPNEVSRQAVINLRRQGLTFVTAPPYRGDSTKFKRGDNVDIFTVGKIDYLRTDGNSYQADNLGNLPEF